jgi:hypothetical protein
VFTGLVETIGVLRRRSGGPVARVLLEGRFGGALVLGESIAVNGVCLTVAKILDGAFEADMSEETLARTTLGALPPGARVHLERATPAGGRLGGHIMAGHVDGIGRVVASETRGDAVALSVRIPSTPRAGRDPRRQDGHPRRRRGSRERGRPVHGRGRSRPRRSTSWRSTGAASSACARRGAGRAAGAADDGARAKRAAAGHGLHGEIEARDGVTTGISAADRAHTIRVAAAPDAKPTDIVRPGHVFPLRARRGGVLVRTGQTEGSVDLARLAGRAPRA